MEKEQLNDKICAAYAEGRLDESGMEDFFELVASADTASTALALAEASGRYAAVIDELKTQISPSVQVVNVTMGTVKKTGNWLTGDKVFIKTSGSSIKLDFSCIVGKPKKNYVVVVDLHGSSLKLKVPAGTQVTEETELHMSTMKIAKNLAKYADPDGSTITISGKLSLSSVKAKLIW